jgi:hypothetical protein
MTSSVRWGPQMRVNGELGLRPSLANHRQRAQHGQRSNEEQQWQVVVKGAEAEPSCFGS